MLNRTQTQVMQQWKKKEECLVLVSVVCTTYNHELYIEEAIQSFLIQETDFPFEIIIHDDASVDNTCNIIKEYHALYPNIIRPIFQKKNQYSQGNFQPSVYAASFSHGKYIALCEGDDYWIDTKKLAKQVASFARHSGCDICFHSACCFDNNKKVNYVINRYSATEHIFLLKEFISIGGGLCPTASLMFRRHVFDEMPQWVNKAPAGDYYFQVFGAKRGGGIYMPDVMSVYRYAGVNSMTTLARKRNLTEMEKFIAIDMTLIDKLLVHIGEEHSFSLKRRKSAIYMEGSFSLLNRGDFNGFIKFIEYSWNIQRYISLLQILIYKLRKLSLLLMLLLRAKRFFTPIVFFLWSKWNKNHSDS